MSNQCAGHLNSNCFSEQKPVGPVVFPGEGEAAEMSSDVPCSRGHFLLARNDFWTRIHLLGRQRKTGLCHHDQGGGTGRREGNVFCLVRTIKHFDSLNVKGELKARRDLGGDLVQHVTQCRLPYKIAWLTSTHQIFNSSNLCLLIE